MTDVSLLDRYGAASGGPRGRRGASTLCAAALRSVALLSCAWLAGCASDDTLRSGLDDRGRSWVSLESAVTLARPAPRFSNAARDYLYVAPVQSSTSGTRRHYLWVGLGTTVDRGWPWAAPSDAAMLLLTVDGFPVTLPLAEWDARAARRSIARPRRSIRCGARACRSTRSSGSSARRRSRRRSSRATAASRATIFGTGGGPTGRRSSSASSRRCPIAGSTRRVSRGENPLRRNISDALLSRRAACRGCWSASRRACAGEIPAPHERHLRDVEVPPHRVADLRDGQRARPSPRTRRPRPSCGRRASIGRAARPQAAVLRAADLARLRPAASFAAANSSSV